MLRMTLAMAAILCFNAAGWGQAYYEASGQTQVFTLKAGAKSGPTAIRGIAVVHAGVTSGVTITPNRGSLLVALPTLQRGYADIVLYDIAGRQLFRQSGYSGTMLRLETRAYAPGIYSMLVRVDGKSYTRRFAMNGRGE